MATKARHRVLGVMVAYWRRTVRKLRSDGASGLAAAATALAKQHKQHQQCDPGAKQHKQHQQHQQCDPGERDGRAVTFIAPASQRLTWWQLLARPHFPALATAALRLLSVHVSTCAAERNWSAWGRLYADALRSSMDMATAEKLVFIQTNDELATNSDSFEKYNGQNVAIQLF
ncbi:hypothetical protein QJQ45_013397 [Haematococcus lacustris]|nr:hypothetical protein QJQ45_013397 [Haematococcus lacustris]